LFSEEQKKAWLALIPKMNDGELSQLHGILSDEVKALKKEGINLIKDPKVEAELLTAEEGPHGASLEALEAAASKKMLTTPVPRPGSQFAAELKREVTTPELSGPKITEGRGIQTLPTVRPTPPAPKIPGPKPGIQPVVPHMIIPKPEPVHKADPKLMVPRTSNTMSSTSGLKSLADIKSVDDLKKIQAAHLRQGPLPSQVALIQNKITTLAHANKILPFYTVNAFEQSPVYKSYLTIGLAMMADADGDRAKAFVKAAGGTHGSDALNFDEFEALADLRKKLESI
jgi:hypothetical protein